MDMIPKPIQKPAVIIWFKVYPGALGLVYLLLLVLGAFMILAPGMMDARTSDDEFGVIFGGIVIALMGLVFAAAFLASLFLPNKPWVWIYDMVLICIGMTSACCLIAAIPLLIFWLKPETKAYFGRG